ncbi:glycosyltransferase [Kaistella sp. DKR-2]|uniref:glycosyltransferase family 2 protein n=1 Tax=Kaistella soli TaxID=2849654 RepID=UPI001C25AA6F|nr:glycosyltransferase [Kaistella soli]MBU8883074.1 glycosyltransferase [Kaistella soli]
MISIVTAYYNRKKLFINTLQSIKRQQFTGDFEVIAVDDGSGEEERLEDLTEEFPFLKVIYLDPANKWYKNSCIPFNIGFRAAKGDKIIIQNPECFHLGDILKYTNEYLNDKNYLSFGCFSLDKEVTDHLDTFLVQNKIEKIIKENAYVVKNDGALGWYNHSLHRPYALHFCTAISKNTLDKLQGFDERFALGIAYDDNEFIQRVRKNLKVKFVDAEIVLHQNHYSPNSLSYAQNPEKEVLMARNQYILANRLAKLNYNYIFSFFSGATKKRSIEITFQFEKKIRYLLNVGNHIFLK